MSEQKSFWRIDAETMQASRWGFVGLFFYAFKVYPNILKEYHHEYTNVEIAILSLQGLTFLILVYLFRNSIFFFSILTCIASVPLLFIWKINKSLAVTNMDDAIFLFVFTSIIFGSLYRIFLICKHILLERRAKLSGRTPEEQRSFENEENRLEQAWRAKKSIEENERKKEFFDKNRK